MNQDARHGNKMVFTFYKPCVSSAKRLLISIFQYCFVLNASFYFGVYVEEHLSMYDYKSVVHK